MRDELIRKLKEIAEEENEQCVDSQAMQDAGKMMQICPFTHAVRFQQDGQEIIEAVYVCRGKVTYNIDEQQLILRPGELLFFNRYTAWNVLPLEEETVAVKINLHPAFFDAAAEALGGEENLLWNFLVRCLREEYGKNQYLYFKTEDVWPVQNFMENIIWTALYHPNRWAANQMTMGLLFTLLLNYTDRLETGGESFEQNLVIQVLRYIEDHYRDGKLNELCQTLGYDIYWLSRAIKRLIGKNYKELLQIKRLNEAAHLLLTTRAAVAEISLAVGYDNTSYFHRIFREYYGLSPKEFRRENKWSRHG